MSDQLNHHLEATLKTIVGEVHTAGYDRVRLYMLTPDQRSMVCRAQVGMNNGFANHVRPAESDPYLQNLLCDPRPRVYRCREGYPAPFDEGDGQSMREWACIPLMVQGRVIGKLSVDNKISGRQLAEDQLKVVSLYASQAAAAIEAARWGQTLETFSKVAATVSSTLDIDEIFRRTCQAAKELFDASHSAVVLFDSGAEFGMVKAEYPVHTGAVGKRLPLRGVNLEERLVRNQTPIVLENVAEELPDGELRDILLGFDIQSLLVAPMTSRGRLIGSFSLDVIGNRRQFTAEEVSLCQTLATQVAMAVENARRFQETKKQLRRVVEANRHLGLAMQANQVIAQADNLTEALRRLAGLIVANLSQTYCRISLASEDGRTLTARAAHASSANLKWNPRLEERVPIEELPGFGRLFDSADRIEGCEIWRSSDETARARLSGFSRSLNLAEDLKSLLLAPLKVENRLVGVLELGEFRDEEYTLLTEGKIKVTSLVATQTAVWIDRLQRLEATQQAVDAMAGAFNLHQVQQTIVEKAREVFQAHSAVVWAYDPELHKFVTDAVVADGISPSQLQSLRGAEPQPGKVVTAILRDGELAVSDLAASDDSVISPPLRSLLQGIGVSSFFGVSLQAGGKPAGILYVNYSQPRSFIEVERQRLKNFASFAALALKKATLLGQVSNAKRLAGVIARVSTLGNREKTLQLIADGTLDALGCDAVTLYAYDQTRDKLDCPPKTAGLYFPELPKIPPKLPDYSFVYQVLQRDEPYIVERAEQDEMVKDRRFTRQEEIKSLVAVPLIVAGRRMGVIFFNYRAEHRFTEDELDNIRMFADLAAVAIHNAQLFGEKTAKLREQQTLAWLSQELLGTANMEETLKRAVEVARSVLETEYASLVLPDENGDLVTRATSGWEEGIADVYRPGNGASSHAGYTVIDKAPVRVSDYLTETRFQAPGIVFDKGIKSGMSAPINQVNGVTGAILAQTLNSREFSSEEETLLKLIADETSMAIQRAQQYEELETVKSRVVARTALAWMGMESTHWQHEIHNGVMAILGRIQLMRAIADQSCNGEAISGWMADHLKSIESEIMRIKSKPGAAPLSSEEGVEDVLIPELVCGRLNFLWKRPEYSGIVLAGRPDPAAQLFVRASPEWVRRALDILIDNAVQAIAAVEDERREISASCRAVGGSIEIAVIDRGRGIPDGVREQLFKMKVDHPAKAKGLGRGLLIAQGIIDTYGGSIRVASTGPSGTEMVIRLPLVRRNTDELN